MNGRMATAGLGRVGGYLEPLQGMHLTGGRANTSKKERKPQRGNDEDDDED